MHSAFAQSIIERLDKPVLTLEMRRAKARNWLVLTVVAGLAPFALYLAVLTTLGAGFSEGMIGLTVFAQGLGLIVFVPIHSVRSICREKERGSLDLIKLTSLTSAEIIDQKMAAVVIRALPLCVLSLPLTMAVSAAGEAPDWAPLLALALPLIVAIGLSYLGLSAGLSSRQSSSALIVVYVALWMACSLAVLIGFVMRFFTIRTFERSRSTR